MNRFTRTCIITALVLIAVGIGVTAAGFFMGGASQIRNAVQNQMPEFFDHAVQTGGGQAHIDKAEGQPMLEGGYSNDQLAKKDQVSKLEAQIGGGQLVIKESDTEYFKVESKTNLMFQCFVENGKLSIRAFEGRIPTGTTKNIITLYVPEGASFDKTDVDLGAGTVDIHKLSSGSVSINVGAGTVRIDSIDANKVDVSIGAGKVDINGNAVDAEADVGMGALKWTGEITRDMDLSCSMGSAELALQGEREDGHNYKISCAAGSVSVGGRSFSGITDDTDIDNGAVGTVSIDCSMGSVRVYFK